MKHRFETDAAGGLVHYIDGERRALVAPEHAEGYRARFEEAEEGAAPPQPAPAPKKAAQPRQNRASSAQPSKKGVTRGKTKKTH